MLTNLFLFAQVVKEKGENAAAPEGIQGFLANNQMIFLIAIMMAFFFLIILPAQRRQRKEQANLLANLKKNDEVITTSGIIGIVAHIKEGGNEVTLKIDDNARIRILRSSVAQIIKKDEPAKEATPAVPPTTMPGDTNIKPSV